MDLSLQILWSKWIWVWKFSDQIDQGLKFLEQMDQGLKFLEKMDLGLQIFSSLTGLSLNTENWVPPEIYALSIYM